MINKPWRTRQKRMSAEDSTEDLISKQESDSTEWPDRLNINDNDITVSVETPNHSTHYKHWHRFVNKSLLVLALVLLLIAVVFMCLFFHQKYLLKKLKNKSVKGGKEETTKPPVCVTSGCVEAAAFMQSAMDKTIDPCDDFYLYSCAGWIKKNPIPDGESSWDTISIVSKRNRRVLKNILEDPRIKSQKDVESVAAYNAYKMYRSCKDLKQINRVGIQPLVALMNEVANFAPLNSTKVRPKHATLMELFKKLYDAAHMTPFYSISVGHDDRNSSRNILQVSI